MTANRERQVCEAVVATGPKGLLSATCGHLRPCGEHDKPSVLKDLLRHAAARRVLRDASSTAEQVANARAVLGLRRHDSGRTGA